MNAAWKRAGVVIGGALVLVLGYDYATYAATGGSLILGSSNYANRVTSLSNTAGGPALNLQTRYQINPPFTTNGRGLVLNLNAQFLGGRSLASVEAGATRLNGLTATQIEAGATAVNGMTSTQIVSTARAGLLSTVVDRDALSSLSGSSLTTVDSFCNAGEVAVGGSVNVIPDGTNVAVITSRPDGDAFGDSPDSGTPAIGWRGVVAADATPGDLLVVHVFCAS